MQDRLDKRAMTSNRVDNNPDAVLERLRAFREVNPLVESYLKQYRPFETVSNISKWRNFADKYKRFRVADY